MVLIHFILSSLVVLFLMDLCHLAEAAYYHCYSSGNFTSGSDYGNNRDGGLQQMYADVKSNNGFYDSQSVYFSNTTVQVHCLGLCRSDLITSDACSICIDNSSTTILNKCPVQMEVIAWDENAGCVVRCSPSDFPYNYYETNPTVSSCNASNVKLNFLPQFDNALDNLTSSIATKAAEDGSKVSIPSGEGDYPNYFATEESTLVDVGLTIYALGFCLPTLSQTSCAACLRATANESQRNCGGKQGATIFTPSCILRYELYRFYGSSYSSVTPLPSSPPPSPSKPPASSPSVVRKEGRNRNKLVAAVVLPMIMIIVLTAITLIRCIVYKVQKKTKQRGADEESTESCLEFSLNELRVATSNFSTHNKLGEGGFGAVYKGCLPNGQQIAVKRLVVHSARGDIEFRNEVQLVARLHHKNLIRLVGFCLEGKERILIYELALNGSLDRFLFDPTRCELLNWEVRCNIIEGVARGMVYLHDESQLKIIHRDVKPANILLDVSMNPKISDFGTARLFDEDQSRASRIVGTYCYMAPEYVKHGKISVKIDVFSFGVLVLEIVCGKKHSASENAEHIEHLLSKVWRYWATGEILKLIDPILLRGNGHMDEITRCIHVGLLCVQGDVACRPTMNSVILMLECCSQILPPPRKPAYFMLTEDDKPKVPLDHDHPVSSEQILLSRQMCYRYPPVASHQLMRLPLPNHTLNQDDLNIIYHIPLS